MGSSAASTRTVNGHQTSTQSMPTSDVSTADARPAGWGANFTDGRLIPQNGNQGDL